MSDCRPPRLSEARKQALEALRDRALGKTVEEGAVVSPIALKGFQSTRRVLAKPKARNCAPPHPIMGERAAVPVLDATAEAGRSGPGSILAASLSKSGKPDPADYHVGVSTGRAPAMLPSYVLRNRQLAEKEAMDPAPRAVKISSDIGDFVKAQYKGVNRFTRDEIASMGALGAHRRKRSDVAGGMEHTKPAYRDPGRFGTFRLNADEVGTKDPYRQLEVPDFDE